MIILPIFCIAVSLVLIWCNSPLARYFASNRKIDYTKVEHVTKQKPYGDVLKTYELRIAAVSFIFFVIGIVLVS